MAFKKEQFFGMDQTHLSQEQDFFGESHLFHPSTHQTLRLMQEEAHKEKIDIKVISGYRSYEKQLQIWNDKAAGIRAVTNDLGQVIPQDEFLQFSPEEKIETIMRFSALPGFSRHHWGSDFDVYDGLRIEKKEVKLIDPEWSLNGPCFPLHQWLDRKACEFNITRPYLIDHGGISIEKWHLSFEPVAQEFISFLTLEEMVSHLGASSITFKEIILSNPEYYFQRFLNSSF